MIGIEDVLLKVHGKSAGSASCVQFTIPTTRVIQTCISESVAFAG